jgi:hypothetical protein
MGGGFVRRGEPSRGVGPVPATTPRAGARGSVAFRNEVLDGPRVGAVARGGRRSHIAALGSTNGSSGRCQVEANAGFSRLRKRKVELGGESLTNVVVEGQAREKVKSESSSPRCAVSGDMLNFGVGRFYAVGIFRVGVVGGVAD